MLLQEIQKKGERLVVGLMSGTSVDGVDAALVKIKNCGTQTQLELLRFISFPYPLGCKERLIQLSEPGGGSVDEICRMNIVIAEVFAEAALTAIREAGYTPQQIDLIGSHGQTVHHLPNPTKMFGYEIRATLQLGEPSVIAKRTGIITVADFRPADLALGGQGAPLIPYFDFIIFRSSNRNRALLNLGGIANFTILKKNCGIDDILAFDTGPANMLIDALSQRLFNQPFDRDGEIARSGEVNEELLNEIVSYPFFQKSPPKSTGREEFGEAFCGQFLTAAARLKMASADIIATATELTARSIWKNYRDFVSAKTKIGELIVSGGGVKNTFVMNSLREKFREATVRVIDDFGIPSDAKEAICFAVLANETICGNPTNVPAATGARAPTILGKICL